MRIKIECKARNLHAAVDELWEREHRPPEWYEQVPACPECGGDHLAESGICPAALWDMYDWLMHRPLHAPGGDQRSTQTIIAIALHAMLHSQGIERPGDSLDPTVIHCGDKEGK